MTVLDDESDKPSAPDNPDDGSDTDSDGDHSGSTGTSGSTDSTTPAATPAAHEGDSTPGCLDLHSDGAATDTGSTAAGTTSSTTPAATTTPHKTTIKPAGAVPQTGDPLWEALLSIGLLAIVSGAAVALARTRARHAK